MRGGSIDLSLVLTSRRSDARISEASHEARFPEELSPAEMTRQIRYLLAYVTQEREGGRDKEIWIMGMDYKKTAYAALSFLRQGEPIPEILYNVLEYFWDSQKGRRRISDVLGIPLAVRNFPSFPQVDDEEWARQDLSEIMVARRLDESEARSLRINRGRETVKEVIKPVLIKARPLREDEIATIANMATTITSSDVIREFLPLVDREPWVGVHILNNFALADGTRELNGFSKINFTPIIYKLLEAAKTDINLARELVKILNNHYTDKVVHQVSFYDDIIEPILDEPGTNPNMMGAFIECGCYLGLEEIYELAQNIDTIESAETRIVLLSSIQKYIENMLQDNFTQVSDRGELPSFSIDGFNCIRGIKDILTRYKIALGKIPNLLGGIRAFMEGWQIEGWH